MQWSIHFSKHAIVFLTHNKLKETFVIGEVSKALQKFSGENSNADIKKLKGMWEGFYRIRSGRLRIILEFNFEKREVHIDRIDWRGNAYK